MIYYNDIDKKACAWIEELIKAELLPDGVVSSQDVKEIKPEDLERFSQVHLFAGIGGWAYALQLAGWGDKPAWTGSCPCQPFSIAGKHTGTADERHLWPAFRWLIDQCKPTVVFGEQTASKAGRSWLTGVRSDLETLGYEVGATDLCAASVNAPHIRQRLWWVANRRMAQDSVSFRWGRRCDGDKTGNREIQAKGLGAHGSSGMAHCDCKGLQGPSELCDNCKEEGWESKESTRHFGTSSGSNQWNDSILHPCKDGKRRRIPTEPLLFPLAYGVPKRVDLLRGAGNAIVPQVAEVVIRSFMDYKEEGNDGRS